MKFMMGKKLGMTQVFNEDGTMFPVTVIQAGPLTVVQKKTMEKEGYTALKVGYEGIVERKLSKPQKGIFTKMNVPFRKYLKEFRIDNVDQFEIGQNIKVEQMFQSGDKIDVSGVSKGKGFQGTIKRYGQKGGPESHGSMYHRRPGSMGANSNPARVFKGKKLPGHMGCEKVTIMNLDVIKVDAERNLLLVRGSVPGAKGALLVVKNAVKIKK